MKLHELPPRRTMSAQGREAQEGGDETHTALSSGGPVCVGDSITYYSRSRKSYVTGIAKKLVDDKWHVELEDCTVRIPEDRIILSPEQEATRAVFMIRGFGGRLACISIL